MTDFTDKDRDRYNKRMWYWATLNKLRAEWMKGDAQDFDEWMVDNHGVRIVYSGGMISGTYEIADDVKHLVFLLRYA